MFFFLRICIMALRGLQANLLRSLLATLGVIIGVSAVVSAMSIMAGAKKDVLERFESMGADQIMIMNGSSGNQARHSILPSLTPDDAEKLQECPLVKAVAPEVQSDTQVKYFQRNVSATILATTPAYSEINNYNTVAGNFITDEEVRAERKVCVLGHKIAEDLFGASAGLGYRIKIRGIPFTVIGVMEKKGVLGFREVDNQVIIPLTTGMKRLFGLRNVMMITVQAARQDQLQACIQQIKRVLRSEHGIRAGAHDDFTVFTQEQAKKQFQDVTKIFSAVLYSIAGISLVVGGIGIMNIMLVSVTERTREIGVRMAVGATRFSILLQFMIEAGIISLLGGSLGVLLGLAFTDLLENIVQVLKTYTPSNSIYLALVMALLVGIVSGIYPAWRASRLDPVEALRFE